MKNQIIAVDATGKQSVIDRSPSGQFLNEMFQKIGANWTKSTTPVVESHPKAPLHFSLEQIGFKERA